MRFTLVQFRPESIKHKPQFLLYRVAKIQMENSNFVSLKCQRIKFKADEKKNTHLEIKRGNLRKEGETQGEP